MSRAAGGRVRVEQAHQVSYEDPIAVKQGDRVLVGRHDDEFPGWAWCTGPHGRQGWTPEQFLSPAAGAGGGAATGSGATEPRPVPLPEGYEGAAVAAVDYDARELTVEPGDEVLVVDEVAGWLLCERGDGGRGWIPATAVAPA